MRSIVMMMPLVAVSSLLVACNSAPPTSGPPSPSGPTITIQGYAFSPLNLVVDAGTTINVVNLDSMTHTVTSEASDDAFTPGAVAGVSFDTGQVSPSTSSSGDPYGGDPGGPYGGGYVRQMATATGSTTITIPASTPSGTVVPYYCKNHTSTMATPNGHITVR